MKPIALMYEVLMIENGYLRALYVIKEQRTSIEVVPDTNEGIEK